jgi:parallel beta-helix repeat protein
MKKPVIIAMILMVSLLAVLPASVSADQYVSPGDNIQAAVDHAAANGGTVVFAPGTYYVNLTILNPAKSLTLLGAGEGVTILNGNASDRVIFIDSDTDSLVAIRGFTITNGSSSVGAGISSRDCSLAISLCIFEDNTAWDDAGGMQIIDDTHTRTISLTNCTFTGNTAGDNGGGLALNSASPTITNCTFTGNTAGDNGGGMHVCNPSYPLIEGCMFIGNTAGKNGGGMMNGDVSAPTVKNCTFSENHAGIQATLAPPDGDGDIQYEVGYGGGMMNASKSAPTVSNCVYSGNTALWAGAGMSNSNRYSAIPVITNCVFVQNEVLGVVLGRGILAGDTQAPPLFSGGGGGMFVGNAYANVSSPIVTNCTFTQNAVPYHDAFGEHDGENGGGVKNAGGAATFTNCIVWGNVCGDNPNDVLNTDGNESTFEYCNIGGGYPGEGNIDADPLFVNAPTIVSLRAASPCVNTVPTRAQPSTGASSMISSACPVRKVADMIWALMRFVYPGRPWSSSRLHGRSSPPPSPCGRSS